MPWPSWCGTSTPAGGWSDPVPLRACAAEHAFHQGDPLARVSAFEPAAPEATRATTARRQARRSPAGAAQLRPSVDPDASRAGVDALGSGAVGRHDRRRLLEFAGAGARRPAPVAADVRGRTRASKFPGADSPSRTRPAARSGDRPRTPGGVPSPPDACLPADAAIINGRSGDRSVPPAVVRKQRISMAVYTPTIDALLSRVRAATSGCRGGHGAESPAPQ